jgi:phenylpropionate dioxygenase-like ring-hydroxylating dioxygenase large terminal subunit
VTDDGGCGLLRCGYHGWTYSSEGIPVGLPGQHENFDLSADERKALQLPRGQAMTVGNFVFFRDAESGHPGGDAFPEAVRTLLLQVSETFDIPFLTTTHSWNANWKAGVENTLEPYHAGFVHSGTLSQVIEPPTERTLNYSLSSHKHPLKQVSRDWWERMINLAGIHPSPHFTDYHHFFVYPNLCIGLTYGSLLSVQVFFPISTDRLTLTSTLFLPSSEAKTASRSVRWTMQEFLSEYNDKILLEDRAPVESCQAGFRDASSVAILGESEERIGFFQKAIVRDIEFENGVSRCI